MFNIFTKYNLETSKNHIVNIILVVAAILGSMTYAASLTSQILSASFNFSLVIETLVFILLVYVTIKRKKLGINFKIAVSIFSIALFALSDALIYGQFSSARIYLVLIPIISILHYSHRKTLFIFLSFLTVFITIGWLHHRGYVTIPAGYQPALYVLRIYPWVINAIHIAAVGFIVFYLTRYFFASFNSLISDMEERNQFQAEQERNYREIFNSTSEAIFIHNGSDGRILDVNDIMLKMFGFKTKEEATQITINDITAADDFFNEERAQMLIRKAQIEGSQVFEWRSKRLNGEIFWAEVSLQKTEAGGEGRVLAVLRDITERKKLETKIKESEAYYRALVETLHDGISLMDLEGNMLFVNSRKAQMVGASSTDSLIGKNAFTLLTAESRKKIDQQMPILISQGYMDNLEAEVQRLDGSTFSAEFNVSVLKDSDGNPKFLMDTMRDITRRKEADSALKESEERYRTLMESMNEVVIVADNNHVVQYVNPQFTKKLGYTPEEIIGKQGRLILHGPEDLELVENANRDRIDKITSSYEIAFRAKNGEKYIFLVCGAPIYDEQGNTIASISSMMDITDRKNAERELRESQQLFETLAQMSPVGIFRTRPDGYTTYVNPKWCELSGLKAEQAIGNGWLAALHPDDRNEVIKNWSEKVEQQHNSLAEYRFLRPDGSVVWVLGNAQPETDNGEVKGYVGTITNITDIKLAQQEQLRQSNFVNSLMNAIPIPVFHKDRKGRFGGCNRSFCEFTGANPHEIKGKLVFEVWPGPANEKIHRMDLELMEQPQMLIYESEIADKQGNLRNVIVAKDVYRDENLNVAGIVGAFIDITDQKQTALQLEEYKNHLEMLVKQRTEELEAANEELRATNEELYTQREELEATLNKLQNTQKQLIQSEKMASLGLLAAGVAHEINNPLNFISGGTTAIENYLAEHAPDHLKNVSELIEILKTGVKRAADIVSSLNHYSRRDDTRNTICDIHTIIDNCLLMLNSSLKNRIVIQKMYHNGSISVKCNEGKIHQVVLNILSNASQAIENEGIICIKTEASPDYLKIEFIDTGCGISPENLDKLTDPFFTTKEPGKGIGLGLSITHSIIEEHNGRLEFQSELGKGTKVIVNLPIQK